MLMAAGRVHAGNGGLELAFRIDQEQGPGHDAFAGFDPFEHLVIVVGFDADFNLPRFEVFIGAIDESDVVRFYPAAACLPVARPPEADRR